MDLERRLAKAREALQIIANDSSSFWFALAERTLAAISAVSTRTKRDSDRVEVGDGG